MKKNLLFAAIAVVALTGCSKNESVDQTGKAIGFDTYVGKVQKGVPVSGTTFADGATMAVYSTKGDVADMANVTVTKTGGAWTYSPVMFYVKELKYKFAALAPATASTGFDMVAGTVTDYTVDADITKQVDFMYAPTTAEITWDGQQATPMAPVQFAFKHALSQVKFSAKSKGDFSKMYTVKITGVTVKQVNSIGTLTIGTDTWSAPTTAVDYVQPVDDFTLTATMATLANSKTATTNNVLMFIPQTWAAELDVEVALTVTAIPVGGGDATLDGAKTLTAKIPAGTWARNKIYNYQMELDLSTILNLKEITFDDPTVEVWDATEVDTPITNPIP